MPPYKDNPTPAHERERNKTGGPGFTRATTNDPPFSMHRLNDAETRKKHSEARAGRYSEQRHWLLRKNATVAQLDSDMSQDRHYNKGELETLQDKRREASREKD